MTFGEGGGVFELDRAAELGVFAELLGAAADLTVTGFGALVAAGSAAGSASALGSDCFSGSFFFGTGEITIDTTWSFWTSAKP